MKFTVAIGYSAHGLDEAVNALIAQGYAPSGGVAMVWGPNGPMFALGMTRGWA